MKTIILDQPLHLRLVEVEPPSQPGPNEALVRVLRVGICGTDLHAFEGKQPFFTYPRILGHELAVEVLALGASDADHGLRVGDRCAVEPYLNCGTCLSCRRGRSNCCMNMRVLGVQIDGGMCESLVVPIRKLHRANHLPLEALATVEMFSIGAHAVSRARLNDDENVLVIGAGPIGMGTMQFARILGANVIAMDINLDRLTFCSQHVGVSGIVDARQDAEGQLRAILNGDLPTAVFDATGSIKSMSNAFNYVAHGGSLTYVGLAQDSITFNDPFFHSREITLNASRNALPSDFEWVIDSIGSGKVDVSAWVTHHATPEALVTDFPTWLLPATGVIKAMLTFES
ncbi:MAG: zinc-binding alcohol dehydrogenase family protein [Anaerolineae bacterium]|nr:zinc-binding alcohol dehydrogenase family protein [Anaerolineae bacterium]